MWASCCHWLCSDSADREAEGAEPRPRSYANSAFSGQPTPPPEHRRHACKACGRRLDAPTAKHVCADCKENYCGCCSAQTEPSPRLCHTCRRFHGNLLQRAELMKLKVKELRDYLHLHRVATHLCREKEELVELILSQQPSPAEAPDGDAPSPAFDGDASDRNPAADPSDRTPPAGTPEGAPRDDDASDRDRGWEAEGDVREAAGRRASLSDLAGEDDVDALSVRQLKEILARNFVDFKGCCEKWELMERVARLYRDRNAPREDGAPPGSDGNLCRICMDAAVDCVLLECGHMMTCTKCGKRMSECPICRQFVIRAVHVFRS